MSKYADYFSANRYKPKYFLGDRVFGRWKKIPFVGTVGNDSLVSEEEGPRISIFLDLPLRLKGTEVSVIIVKHKDIKRLNDLDAPPKVSKQSVKRK
jgi:hypothetical protein